MIFKTSIQECAMGLHVDTLVIASCSGYIWRHVCNAKAHVLTTGHYGQFVFLLEIVVITYCQRDFGFEKQILNVNTNIITSNSKYDGIKCFIVIPPILLSLVPSQISIPDSNLVPDLGFGCQKHMEKLINDCAFDSLPLPLAPSLLHHRFLPTFREVISF